ncbi:hypothetical protein Vau01_087940 [Virgisporangium aurantiacum]|uniref:Uncharacterized protein n=1 Tax=Virgisporangium aurantiacum TaxID=175570 RepID=A0A8J3ZEE6_9ACTN|nr:hypothetical protein Vau01_087940 [Virgisporangium aurantiacum]
MLGGPVAVILALILVPLEESKASTLSKEAVTLPTGDRVVPGRAGGLQVTPAPGRERTPYIVRRTGRRTHVLPADVAQPGHGGRFDPAPFDVSGLFGAEPAASDKRPAVAGTAALTVRAIDRLGRPAQDGEFFLTRTDAPGEDLYVAVRDGVTTVEVPMGSYVLTGSVQTGPAEITWLAQPRLVVTGTREIIVDARAGRPVSVTVPRPTARPLFLEVRSMAPLADGQLAEEAFYTLGTDGVTLLQLPPDGPTGGYASMVSVLLGEDAYVYALAWRLPGGFPTGFARTVTGRSLATVVATHGAQVAGSTAVKTLFPRPSAVSAVVGRSLSYALPFTRTEYYNTDSGGVDWQATVDEFDGLPHEDPYDGLLGTLSGVGTRTEAWNMAVHGPALGDPDLVEQWISRNGDTMVVAPRLFGDGAGHAGLSRLRAGRTVLSRNGSVVAESAEAGGNFTVPAAPGRYRLEVSATRAAPFTLSTTVTGVWTFDSGHVAGPDWWRPHLHSVSFAAPRDAAPLGADGTAPVGRTVALPFRVAAQDGPVGPGVTPVIEVSFDDGASWRQVAVSGQVATVRHPAGSGFVSLRARVADGGTVSEQTVIRAYRYGP